MKACGIITEYNPFHNGHMYHIEQARKLTNCDVLIAVMSGNFVQRGEPAIVDKWIRASYAIQHGVDLVIELPFPYAVQSADYFAKGAIQCLQLAKVSDIVFGSETNNLAQLKHIVSNTNIQTAKDISFAANFAQHHTAFSSNDILGVSYLKALKHTSIQAHTIQRTNQYHDTSLQQTIASASAIRKGVLEHQDVSHTTVMADVLHNKHAYEHYYPLIQHILQTTPASMLQEYFLMDEGIQHQMIRHSFTCQTLQEFLQACTSKRYTKSRIQRTLIHLMTHTTKKQIQALPSLQHLRILAFNDKGRQYLSKLKKESSLILASRFNQIPEAYRTLELQATCTYAFSLSPLEKQKAIQKEWNSVIYKKSYI